MKSTLILFIFCILFQSNWAQENTNLPKEPWEAIVDMAQRSPDAKWTEDIHIKLFGNYTAEDSSMVANAIKQLNDLTETIEIDFTPYHRGNFEIFFIDSSNTKKYESIIIPQKEQESQFIYSNSFYHIKDSIIFQAKRHMNLGLKMSLVPRVSKQNFITNTLAKTIYPAYWSNKEMLKDFDNYQGPVSIFSSMHSPELKPYYSDFSDFDQKVIRAVYSSNFNKFLPQAQKVYKAKEVPRWIKKNSYPLLVFPAILLLFLFTGIVIFIYKKWFNKISNNFLRFNITSLISLLFLGLSITLYSVSADQLNDPLTAFIPWKEIRAGITATLIIGIFAVNIFRPIEILINRNSTKIYFKTLLTFLSTSLIPSITMFALYFSIARHTQPREQSKIIGIMFIISMVFVVTGIIRALILYFSLKEKEIKTESEVKLAKLRELKTRAELNALHSKINPHFLYNSLNSIAGLSKTNADKTEQMALSLSKLFRYSINKEQNDWTTLAEELEMVKIYLSIEKVRFDDRLDFSIEISDELKNKQVPRFIIQPLVENAIKHGISKRLENGIIKVSIKQDNEWTEVSIVDNGPDFPKELNPGFGLQSIYDKLEILYPDRFEIHFVNTPNKHILIKLADHDQL